METNDLCLEYARVIEMCKGTALEYEPWGCVKYAGRQMGNHPGFKGNSAYEFAVAILEDKPVFIGDVIYDEIGIELYCGAHNFYSDIGLTAYVASYNTEYFRKLCRWNKTDTALQKFYPALRTVTLRETGEIRKPREGEYIFNNGNFCLCRKPERWGNEHEIWVEVKP